MRARWFIVPAIAAAAIGTGTAIATHVPEVPPAAVPPGFLETHNDVANFRIGPFARAVRHRRADVFVHHIVLGPNAATGWHTHPGPVIVTVARGSFTYQDERRHNCQSAVYTAGHGFVDPGFGHVHRGIAGPDGADLYATYVVPSGSGHVISADPPAAC